jgi:hypothetical protein
VPSPRPEPDAGQQCRDRKDNKESAEPPQAASKNGPQHEQRGGQGDEENGGTLDGMLEGQRSRQRNHRPLAGH